MNEPNFERMALDTALCNATAYQVEKIAEALENAYEKGMERGLGQTPVEFKGPSNGGGGGGGGSHVQVINAKLDNPVEPNSDDDEETRPA